MAHLEDDDDPLSAEAGLFTLPVQTLFRSSLPSEELEWDPFVPTVTSTSTSKGKPSFLPGNMPPDPPPLEIPQSIVDAVDLTQFNLPPPVSDLFPDQASQGVDEVGGVAVHYGWTGEEYNDDVVFAAQDPKSKMQVATISSGARSSPTREPLEYVPGGGHHGNSPQAATSTKTVKPYHPRDSQDTSCELEAAATTLLDQSGAAGSSAPGRSSPFATPTKPVALKAGQRPAERLLAEVIGTSPQHDKTRSCPSTPPASILRNKDSPRQGSVGKKSRVSFAEQPREGSYGEGSALPHSSERHSMTTREVSPLTAKRKMDAGHTPARPRQFTFSSVLGSSEDFAKLLGIPPSGEYDPDSFQLPPKQEAAPSGNYQGRRLSANTPAILVRHPSGTEECIHPSRNIGARSPCQERDARPCTSSLPKSLPAGDSSWNRSPPTSRRRSSEHSVFLSTSSADFPSPQHTSTPKSKVSPHYAVPRARAQTLPTHIIRTAARSSRASRTLSAIDEGRKPLARTKSDGSDAKSRFTRGSSGDDRPSSLLRRSLRRFSFRSTSGKTDGAGSEGKVPKRTLMSRLARSHSASSFTPRTDESVDTIPRGHSSSMQGGFMSSLVTGSPTTTDMALLKHRFSTSPSGLHAGLDLSDVPSQEEPMMIEVIERIYIANVSAMCSTALLALRRIRFVVNLSGHEVPSSCLHLESHEVFVPKKTVPPALFKEGSNFIRQRHTRGYGIVLYSEQGASRAPGCLLDFMVRHCRLPLRSSIDRVRSKLPQLSLSLALVKQLCNVEQQELGDSSIDMEEYINESLQLPQLSHYV